MFSRRSDYTAAVARALSIAISHPNRLENTTFFFFPDDDDAAAAAGLLDASWPLGADDDDAPADRDADANAPAPPLRGTLRFFSV